MKFFSIRSLSIALVFVMLTISGLAFMSGLAHAATWTGRAQKYGYFDNKLGDSASPYPDQRGPVIDNDDYANDAIPSSVTTKATLLSYLQDKYNNPGTYGHANWDQTGVSFIVNTLLGNDPGSGSRTVTSAMWTDLTQRLNVAGVTLSVQTVSAASYGSVNTYYQYGNNDVAWYSDSSESGKAIVLSSGGTVRYVLLYACANPLGNLGGLLQPPQWTISTATTATKTNSTTTPALAANEVIPGDTITWTHTIKNNGPDATDADVAWRYNNSGNLSGSGGNWTFGSGSANGATASNTSTYTATNNDLGKQVCRSTWAQPHAWNDSGATESAAVCYNVVYRYNLTPHATFNGSLEKPVELGSATPTTINQSVDNSGPTLSQPTAWVLVRCTYVPTVPAGTYASTAANSGSSSVGASCVSIANGSNSFGTGTTNLPDKTGETVPAGTPAGTHICYVLSVNPASATDGSWKHSAPACLSVTKSPKVQAWGADIRGGTIATRPNYAINGKYYGSWAEYGVFGTGSISGLASNASLAGGAPSSPSTAALAALTFANTPSLGYFQPTPAPDGYYNTYYALRTQTTGSTTAGGPVDNDTRQVIAVNGDLTISQNITYTGSYAAVGDIPQIIYVVSGNIKIDASVTQVDAWLIAKGTLYTCSDDSAAVRKSLTLSDCNQPLVFNGPVNVGDTRLSRTYGADGADEGDPAEVFNLAPSNFLSSYTATITQSNIQTVYEKELPPRW